MNKIIITIAFVLALTAQCNTISAQKMQDRQAKREALAERQAKFIAKEMQMDATTSSKFMATYLQYQKETWALGPKRPPQKKKEMTEEATEAAIKANFAHSRKILDIREKYYGEYRKFLSPKQIMRVYRLEKKMMDKLSMSKKGKKPSKKG